MTKDKGIEEFNPKQKDIYASLKDIGEEISGFYFEGLQIIQGDSKMKSYLLAHVAREVDGCLRDFLVNDELKMKECEKCGQKINNLNHKENICIALGVDESDRLAEKWFDVSREFHKYAHRHGAYKSPRDPSMFLDIWNEYEDVLFKLVGCYLSLLDRVDKVLKFTKPNKHIIGVLTNMLKSEARFKYFFSHLNSEEWLSDLNKLGFFDPKNNPKPREDPENKRYYSMPHWSVLEYLKKLVGKNVSSDTTNLINKIVHEIINYSGSEGKRIDNYITDGKIIEISSKFPLEFIDDDFFEFLEKALNSKWGPDFISAEIEKYLINKFIDENAKEHLIKLINIILKYKKSTSVFEKHSSIMAEYWLDELLAKHGEKIVKICGGDLIATIESKIKAIKNEDKNSFHYISISNIGGRVDRRSTENYTNHLVYLLRDALNVSPVEVAKGDLKKYLQSECDIFQRIAIYVIGKRFEEFADILFEINFNPIDQSALKHELFELFKNNCQKFKEKNLEQIIQWIEKQKIFPNNKKEDKKAIEQITARRKKEWLFSLLDCGNEKILTLYNKYDQINPSKLDHPGLNFWSEGGCVKEKSPINCDQLLQLDNKEIAKQLETFKDKKRWKGSTKQGFANVLEASVIENPEKFTKDLTPFFDLDLIYLNSLIKGFCEAWKSKKSFNWEYLLQFIEKIISNENFWKIVSKKGEYNYKNWILSIIAELIESGTQNDENAFDIDLLPKAIEILSVISNKSESDLEDINNDVVTSVINSVKGKIYKAMIDCSLRSARVKSKKEDTDKWIKEIKDHFNYIINNPSNQTVEFYTVVGEYLKNIYHLNKEWVAKNIDKIFPKDNDLFWESAFTGYLYYSLNKDLTPMVIKNGNYDKAINYDLKGEYANKYLVQHICLLYIQDEEKLSVENSLIVKLLNEKKRKHISELIWYFQSQRKDISNELKEKIKPIWSYIINILKEENTSESKEHLSNLAEWLSLVDEIDDEILEWLKISARSFNKEYKASTFTEYLHQHADKTPDKVGEIFMSLLDSGIFPLFREEDIIGIVEKLYSKDSIKLADLICNKYAENGVYFLRDIYNSNQNNKT